MCIPPLWFAAVKIRGKIWYYCTFMHIRYCLQHFKKSISLLRKKSRFGQEGFWTKHHGQQLFCNERTFCTVPWGWKPGIYRRRRKCKDCLDELCQRRRCCTCPAFMITSFVLLMGIITAGVRYYTFVSETIYTESVAHLTEIFRQTNSSLLGMAITKNIIDMMGGTIELHTQ